MKTKYCSVLFVIVLMCCFYSSLTKLITNIKSKNCMLIKSPNANQKGTLLVPDKNSSPLKETKEKIGRKTWALLHSIAASYPVNPTKEDKEDIKNFLGKVYPCKECGPHWLAMLKKYPIRNNSRVELVFYLCGLHNKVNKRLGKPLFDCQRAMEFWGGDCGCQESKKK